MRMRSAKRCASLLPTTSKSSEQSLAAVKNVLSEVLHLKDGVVRASARRSIQMRVNHFSDYYMMVTLLDDRNYPAFNRPRHVHY